MRGTEEIDQAIDIERALARLTAKQREAVTLAMQGYTQKEIAEVLGITRENVAYRISRAYKSLQKPRRNVPCIMKGIDD